MNILSLITIGIGAKRNPKLSFTVVHTLGYSTPWGTFLKTFLRSFLKLLTFYILSFINFS